MYLQFFILSFLLLNYVLKTSQFINSHSPNLYKGDMIESSPTENIISNIGLTRKVVARCGSLDYWSFSRVNFTTFVRCWLHSPEIYNKAIIKYPTGPPHLKRVAKMM